MGQGSEAAECLNMEFIGGPCDGDVVAFNRPLEPTIELWAEPNIQAVFDLDESVGDFQSDQVDYEWYPDKASLELPLKLRYHIYRLGVFTSRYGTKEIVYIHGGDQLDESP